MPYRLVIACLSAIVALGATPLLAHEYRAGDLTIGHPFAYATPKGAMAGGGYMRITNAGTADDRLIGLRADFPRVMLHDTQEKDGIARMMHLETLDIPAGETVVFAPGGMHVMFMGLDGDPFEPGETIPATLVFETAGEVEVEFLVEERPAPGEPAPSAEADAHHHPHVGSGTLSH